MHVLIDVSKYKPSSVATEFYRDNCKNAVYIITWVWSHDTLTIQEKAVELSRTMSPIYEYSAGCSSLPASTRECLRFRFVLCVLLLLSYFAFCCFCWFFWFFLHLFYKIATVTINGYFVLTPSMSMIKQIQWVGTYDLFSPFCTRFVKVVEKEVLFSYHTH